MRILVTGGNGFVGRHLVALLRARGDDVFVAARPHDGDGVDFPLDLTDAAGVRAVVATAQADLIFHLAAQAFVPDAIRDPLTTYDVNALGTARVCDAVRQSGRTRCRILIVSSADVYGARERADYPLRESLAPLPANPYAASKAAAEAIALAAARTYDLDVVVARAFNHIGPGQNERFAIPSFAHQLARVAAGGPPQMWVGNLDAYRDFLDVRDVVTAYAALAREGASGEIYNVCSGEATALREVLRRLVTVARVPVEIREDPERMRPSDVPLSYGDPAKLHAATRWRPERSLDTALRDVYGDAVQRLSEGASSELGKPSDRG